MAPAAPVPEAVLSQLDWLVMNQVVGGGAGTSLLSLPGLSEAQWASLVLVPVASILLAAITARATVLRTLSRMP